MTAPIAHPFRDNWAYLKVELQWLERLLLVAVARRRQDDKVVNPLAKTAADRATSHWWKGVIALEPTPAYDERPAQAANLGSKAAAPALNYQQQLDLRITASQAQGVILGIPLLRDHLALSRFEKNVLLLAIAPEVNRRYARLYRFLEGEGVEAGSDLPTVDLALRLLCHSDEEWRQGRSRLAGASPLLRAGILMPLQPAAATTLLSQRLQLTPAWVEPLLMEQPQNTTLLQLLGQSGGDNSVGLGLWRSPGIAWGDLLLSPALLLELKALGRAQVTRLGAVADATGLPKTAGATVLLVGPAGVGKTAAAQAIATQVGCALWEVDLAAIAVPAQPALWQDLPGLQAPVVLLQSAQVWLGRSATPAWDLAAVQAWLQRRREVGDLTLCSVASLAAVRPRWRSLFDQILTFALPDAALRYRLWQQSFPLSVRVAADLDWAHLAAQLAIGGGEIHTIAAQAIALAQVSQTPVQHQHLQAALYSRGHHYTVRRQALSPPTGATDPSAEP